MAHTQSAQETIVIPVPREVLRRVILDFPGYAQFLPMVTEVTAEAVAPNQWRIVEHLDVIKRISLPLVVTAESDERISWVLEKPGMISKLDGSWTLIPDGPSATRTTYAASIEFSVMVPQMFAKKLTEVYLPKMLNLFKDRAEKLHRGQG